MTGRTFELEFKALFRRFGQREQAAYVDAIRRARPRKAYPDGEPMGGSLASKASKASILRVKRWGYVLRWYDLGQVLTWYVRGASRANTGIWGSKKGKGRGRVRSGNTQPARPIKVETEIDKLTAELHAGAVRQIEAWDRSKKAPNA